jgi:hypothetical protein
MYNCTYVAREGPPNIACGPHTHGSWKPLTYNIYYLSYLVPNTLTSVRYPKYNLRILSIYYYLFVVKLKASLQFLWI